MFAPVETPAQRILALQERLRVVSRPPRPSNPWQGDYHKFATDWIWTKDEERAGQVAKLPDWPHFKDFADALITKELLLVEKSRRVMASWFVCGFDLWLAAGGQDERWPTLMRSTQNRSIVIAALKLKGKNGSHWFLHQRIKFIYNECIRRGIREVWPEFPTFRFTYDQAEGSNGSMISAIPQGEDQSRGGGETFIHDEEFAMWPQAQASLAVQIPCVKNGGHIALVTTPQVASFCAALRAGELSQL